MSPYQFRILLDCYCGMPPEDRGEPIFAPTMAELEALGLIAYGGAGLPPKATEKCKLYIDAALSTPLPVRQWVIPPRPIEPGDPRWPRYEWHLDEPLDTRKKRA